MVFLLKMGVLSSVFLALFITFCFAQLEITEVMYAPSPMKNNEWVEVLNSGNNSLNLSLWRFRDNKEEDNLTCCLFLQECSLILEPQRYAVITSQDTTFFLHNTTALQLCVNDKDIGDGLRNEGDSLTFTSDTFEDHFSYNNTYNKSMGANGNNHTLEKVSSGWRQSLLLFGTPGKRNEVSSPDTAPSPELPPSQNNQTTISPNATSPNFANFSCDIAIDISVENPLFHAEKISFFLLVKNNTPLSKNTLNFSERSSVSVRGNIATPEGKKIKEYSPWTNDKLTGKLEKSYAPSLSAGVYLLSFWLVNSSCEDSDASNNLASRLIAIIGSSAEEEEEKEEEKDTESSVDIEEISLGNDNFAAWGESIPVKVTLSKGNTSKTVVELKAKKSGTTVSETSKVYMSKKFSSLTATIPLQLRCSSGEGEVTAVLEGLGVETEKTFAVKGSAKRCEESVSEKEEINVLQEETPTGQQNFSSKFNFTFEELPETAITGEIFPVQVRVKNDDSRHTYHLWAYLYRGNKCYSCNEGSEERNASIKKIYLIPAEETVVYFSLPIDTNVELGKYKLKVKLLKDEQKTAKELSREIVLTGKEKPEKKENVFTGASMLGSLQREKTAQKREDFSATRKELIQESKGITIYQTPEAKTLALVPMFLAVAFGLVIVAMVIKKK